MKYLRTIAIALLFTGLFACDDDDTIISEVTGTVFQGTAANNFEDCGWLIDINGTPYAPNVLNRQFEQEGLEVRMKVEFLGERSTCAPSTVAPERIRIEQISVAN